MEMMTNNEDEVMVSARDGFAHRRFWLGLLLCGFMAGMVVFLLSPNGEPAYTPDSIAYLTAAQQLQLGKGFSLPNFALFHPQDVPLTTWPPLYPVLLASGIPPLLLQSMIMALLAMIICGIYAASLRLPLAQSVVAGLVTVLVWPLLVDATYVWSELLALMWIAVAIFALSFIYGGKRKSWIGILVASAAVSLAIYTRYASIVFVPALALSLLTAPVMKGKRWLVAFSSTAIIGVLIFPLLVRNFYLTGHLSGAARNASSATVAELLPSALSHVVAAFGATPLTKAAFIVCIVALVVVFAYLRIRRVELHFSDPAMWMARVALFFAVLDLLGIVVLRAWRTFDPIDTRLTSMAIPLLIMSLVAFAAYVWGKIPATSFQRSVLVAPVLGCLILAATASLLMTHHAWHNWRTFGSPQWPMRSSYAYSNLRPVAVRGDNLGVILCSRPLMFHFRTGLDFRRIPAGPWDRDMLEKVVQRANALLIDGNEAVSLARAIQSVRPDLRQGSFGGMPLVFWEVSDASN